MPDGHRLSAKSVAVLNLIAEGQSYTQIVDGHPGISYLDIFAAAGEALRLDEPESDYQARLQDIRSRYQRAYERWTEGEDAQLRAMFTQHRTIQQMATRFQRQPSAIRARLSKLGLDATQTDRTER